MGSDLYHLLRIQRENWESWSKTHNKDYLDTFFEITKMIVRTCLAQGLYHAAISNANSYIQTKISIDGVKFTLSMLDMAQWDMKYARCMALNSRFQQINKDAMELYNEATAKFYGSTLKLTLVDLDITLKAFQKCAILAKDIIDEKQLYCQSLHECGDVCFEIGLCSENEMERLEYLNKALNYYNESIAACNDEFQDSIVADSLIGKGKTLLEIDKEKNANEIREVFGSAYDLLKTSRIRAEKVKIIDYYIKILDDKNNHT
jgi:N12 class adenine-specific DNA methylase